MTPQVRYQKITLIGEGGLGRVYRAFDRVLGRYVAIKVLHRELADKPEQAERFNREFEILKSLSHPMLPEVYDQGVTPKGEPYFTCQFLGGRSMAEWIEQWKRGLNTWTLKQKLDIFGKLCRVLRYVQAQGVLHRDIKPENIMMTEDGQVWLLDWGLATLESEQEGRQRLTAENTFLGTLRYAAPEQIQGQRLTDNDVFSLGATVYELFTLRQAHPGEKINEVISAVLMIEPQPADQVAPVPTWLSTLLSNMLKKNPSERVRSLSEIESLVEAADAQPVVNARRCGLLVMPVGLAS